MRELHFGDRGAEVGYLQRLLNLENVYIANADAELREDCSFGPRTLARLNSHQHTMGLPPSDRVDARMWQQLGHLIAVEHAVELFPQPTDQSCWSAAATMLFGDRSVGAGNAAMSNGHFLDADPDNIRLFLREQGLTFHEPRNWTIRELIEMLRNGPLWAAGHWSGRDARGRSSGGGHVVVISAVWSHQSQNYSGAAFRIHDPWPPGRGDIYGATYNSITFSAMVRRGVRFNAGMVALAHR